MYRDTLGTSVSPTSIVVMHLPCKQESEVRFLGWAPFYSEVKRRMTIRCKACDAVLKPREEYINKKTGRYEELCGICRAASFMDDRIEMGEETIDSIEDLDEASKTLDQEGETW